MVHVVFISGMEDEGFKSVDIVPKALPALQCPIFASKPLRSIPAGVLLRNWGRRTVGSGDSRKAGRFGKIPESSCSSSTPPRTRRLPLNCHRS